MFEIRIHGRAGQGVLATAELLAIAGSLEGRHSQALPSFGTERTDGEAVAFCRIGRREIHTQAPVLCPDTLVVTAEELLGEARVLDGLGDDGYLLVNSGQRVDNLALPPLPLKTGARDHRAGHRDRQEVRGPSDPPRGHGRWVRGAERHCHP